MSFSVSSSIEHSGAVVISVRGTVEHTTVASLCDTINHDVEQHRPAFVYVDLQYVTYIDAAAVGALDACRRSARNGGTSVLLRNASAAVDRTLQLSGMFGRPGG
ncbi:STAS domain-containing protein [Dactylosporangium aurantiacum]|uniref:STAS domain-containing protein n=1 Tax=Dactylosporangium aurantiacum TaxID=35754 RepID=A0A9Q9I847_9ACTN|nr:STAS domain-containing protein [Dactylosporangium aurantiacum]MDG6108714.1 STAS domain-containing protein [Dactylosporangium aurantiacum]UWZ51077.1 STAS domain-containing protein [Dactylosporangium aurantiacum]